MTNQTDAEKYVASMRTARRNRRKRINPNTNDINSIYQLRDILEPHFSLETAFIGSKTDPPSSGHCAVVAVIVKAIFRGDYVSTHVGVCENDIWHNESHWFNRITQNNHIWYCDLTGDQYGFAPVRITKIENAYEKLTFSPIRIRSPLDVNVETLERAQILSSRAGLTEVKDKIDFLIEHMCSK